MRFLYAQIAFALATTASTLAIRDEPLNGTSIAPVEPAQSTPQPSETEIEEQPTKSRKPNCDFCRPHPEETATEGFDEPTTTAQRDGGPSVTPSQPDLGGIIKSYFTVTSNFAKPSIHDEQTTDAGFDQGSQAQPTRTGILHPPHMEASANGDGFIQPTTAGNAQDNRPQVTPPPGSPAQPGQPGQQATKQSPPPEITLGGITLRPTPVTSAQVITIDGKPTSTNVVNFEFAIGSSVLPVGSVATINGVQVAVNVVSGSTVLVAGDKTTTLPASVQNLPAVQTNQGEQLPISTLVQDGTTKYVLAGQTLAPGQAVTVGTVPVSFTTQNGHTVLVVGSVTTTLVPNTRVPTTVAESPSISRSQPKPTSSKGGAMSMTKHQISPVLAHAIALLGTVLSLL